MKAHIQTIEGFSAHADRSELLAWFESLGGLPRRSYIVHGEEDTAVAFGDSLRGMFDAEVTVPALGESFPLT